jgi:hypothetical protein
MDSPSFWSLGTNNVLVGTSIHGMSVAAVQTAATAALAARAKYKSNVHIQHVRLSGRQLLGHWGFTSPIGVWAPSNG